MHTVALAGNIGSDPEIKTVGSKGTELAEVSLAVNRYQGPTRDPATDWYRLQLWGGKSKLAKHLAKGDKVAVSGEIAIDEWEDNDGNPRTTVKVSVRELEFMGGRGSSTDGFNEEEEDLDEDDLPF